MRVCAAHGNYSVDAPYGCPQCRIDAVEARQSLIAKRIAAEFKRECRHGCGITVYGGKECHRCAQKAVRSAARQRQREKLLAKLAALGTP
jgi:hypothetical protein